MEMLKEMAVFVRVTDKGGFAAAARDLGLTTSSVSRHVSRLESHLGGRLLHRSTRSLALTELGDQAYAACSKMLSAAREVYALADNYSLRPSGTLYISSPVVFGEIWVAPRISGFLQREPLVEVKLVLNDRTVDLIEDGFDVAIRISDSLAPGLAARKLGTYRHVLIASPQYLKDNGEPTAPEELRDHNCIHLGYGAYRNKWKLLQGKTTVDVTVPSRATANNSNAIIEMVQSGTGIGLVSEIAACKKLESGEVSQVLPGWKFGIPYTRSVYVVYRPGPYLPLKIRAFIDYLVESWEDQMRLKS